MGYGIRESTLLFPVIETVHVLGLSLSVGTIAVVDLRLLGLGLRREPVSQVIAQMIPWSLGGFINHVLERRVAVLVAGAQGVVLRNKSIRRRTNELPTNA